MASKGMENFVVQTIDGVNYPCCLATDDMHLQLPLICDFDIRHDDVIIVGLPKMGNHWTFDVVNMILKQTTDIPQEKFTSHMMDYTGPEMPEKLAKLESPRVLAMHLFMDKLPKQVTEKKTKVIFQIRNPKDVWTSGYHGYSNLSFVPRLHYTGNWDDFFQLRMRGGFIFDSWFENIRNAERYMEGHPDVPVYVSSFEKMKLDPKGAIRDLCNFLGKPTDLVDEIAQATSFKNVQDKLKDTKMANPDASLVKEKEFIMRKGEICDWKNLFTEEQNEAFNKLFEKETAGSKLAYLVRPYL